jgi:hypothetical protein
VNTQHFKSFVWLRWRLKVNQFRRGGVVNLVFFIFVVVMAAIAAVGLFVTGLLVGWFALPRASPAIRMYVWDGIIVAFLFFWMIGLLTELQRTESLALDKFLHLPVSLSSAFLINYLSSLASLTLLVCVPAMVGLVLGQTFAHGPAMLLGLPLVAAFVLAVTAVTYQFQGWLATLMSNPRRRRTVIVVVTMAFILIFQLPNLINIARPWEKTLQPWERQQKELAVLSQELGAGKINAKEYQERQKEIIQRTNEETLEASRQTAAQVERTTRIINLAIPLGWLALGAKELPDNHVIPALLATVAYALIGGISLWRSYRTTLRYYTGQYSTGEKAQPATTTSAPATPAIDSNKPRFMEWRLPCVSEYASAVAVASFRSMTRAPEAKMAFLAPIIMVVVFGGILISTDSDPPRGLRPLVAIGAAAVMLLSAIQLIGNQFGYDRSGFRAFVLSPIPRREILVGKNLAVAPLAVGIGIVLLLITGTAYPMRPDHYFAAVMQLVGAFLLFCLMANALSIFAPMFVAAGSMKASDVKIVPVLLQMMFLMLLPIVFVPALVPIGVEALLNELDILRGWPVSLALSFLFLAGAFYFYRLVVTAEGAWLEAREQKVLAVVTGKSD